MAGDASGGRRDGADTPETSRESPETDPIDESELGRGADGDDARDRTPDDDRIPLDLSGGTSDDDESEADAEDDPYAPEPSSTPIERGDPTLENAFFVVLGALAMLLVIARMVAIPL